MAYVIGPNGRPTYIPDAVAAPLVGDGTGEYRYAPEAERPAATTAKPAPRRRTPRAPKKESA